MRLTKKMREAMAKKVADKKYMDAISREVQDMIDHFTDFVRKNEILFEDIPEKFFPYITLAKSVSVKLYNFNFTRSVTVQFPDKTVILKKSTTIPVDVKYARKTSFNRLDYDVSDELSDLLKQHRHLYAKTLSFLNQFTSTKTLLKECPSFALLVPKEETRTVIKIDNDILEVLR